MKGVDGEVVLKILKHPNIFLKKRLKFEKFSLGQNEDKMFLYWILRRVVGKCELAPLQILVLEREPKLFF